MLGSMNQTIWIVITEDRHTDTDVHPFTSPAAAFETARTEAEANAGDPQDVQEAELTPAMTHDGWVLLLYYGTEGDHVRVVKRELDKQTAV
jgi:hypothetical protein